MKQQIARLSPHQNGKVFAVLMTVTSLIFMVPFFLLFAAITPAQARPPIFMLVVLPLVYLVVGYVGVAVGCALYNFLYRFVGGVEFEASAPTSS